MIKQVTFGLAFVLATAPAIAQQPATTDKVADKTASKPHPKICKRSAPAGSMIETRRDCHTREEWNEMAQSARATGQDMVDRSAAGGH
ncbi:hypothetical protein C8J42_101873 [Sphingomonas sp. PP-CE-1A-559]|jgi:hypothetical protein|uniref:hypothetical protein n=1 Tax=Sphingomonas TaxID=13687 RepID=UPI0006F8E5DD|nr:MULTISPECIES: hypothetical protein [unclassified Sphingomonas]KQN02650.1 hypothetical protein ASE82_10085 [Sphingomonas sp. Leaf230]RKE53216.1 hypothetical protein C8J39_0354 [Sphingomonas sp. PP-CC-1A-547]TCM09710.1 hypothetical protein C8J41_101211 [Sphingomonas sp. PP-CC-3G-468]TCP94409.1 hypothetical protein C8J42_101873 [Sphingomonas sp. PP-CE-1A-559]